MAWDIRVPLQDHGSKSFYRYISAYPTITAGSRAVRVLVIPFLGWESDSTIFAFRTFGFVQDRYKTLSLDFF